MKERQLLMSKPVVRSTLREIDPKTQTRRVCKNKVYGNGFKFVGQDYLCHNDYLPPSALLMDYRAGGFDCTTSDHEGWGEACPYGLPGDRLWLRETYFAWGRWETRFSAKKGRDEWHFIDMTAETGNEYLFSADGYSDTQMFVKRRGGVSPMYWKRPAIFMPRVACRLIIEVTGVRVERLQDISEADAIAEGIELMPGPEPYQMWRDYSTPNTRVSCPIRSYQTLWESINGLGSWDLNPFVWVVEFTRLAP